MSMDIRDVTTREVVRVYGRPSMSRLVRWSVSMDILDVTTREVAHVHGHQRCHDS